MKKVAILAGMMVMILGFSMQAHSSLSVVGQGTSADGTYSLIYDTDLNVTWYDFTRNANSWQSQMNWADALTVTFGNSNFDNWRLPTIIDNGAPGTAYDGSRPKGYNVTNSDMGHLFYEELGNTGRYDTNAVVEPFYGLSNKGPFGSLLTKPYWTNTLLAANTSNAWNFTFSTGEQSYAGKSGSRHAIALHEGNIASAITVVPEPISSTLFIVSGAIMGLRQFRKKTKNY
ncbi:MAG: hypothetical protein H8D23_31040 [Candidatus Brocadiales bacterium]|nr:hypothetical protein [Candidatus Brocadiales bacterium]